ncbi:transmembrane protein 254 [Candoia aspera]|uniref:transmembrane protein 254 n=1 Tax=Candoia aspera TaxID=51853 RepID=UPI002FD7C163
MAPRSASGPEAPATYFRTVRPFWMVLIAAGMIYYGWAVFAPSTIHYDILGPLGKLTKYLQETHKTLFKAGYAISWLIHIGEAFLSLWVCNIKGVTDNMTRLWWFTQTLLFGSASLYWLLVYKPPRKSH